MQFVYDPERLIEEVKKRPGIWDYDHVDYKIKLTRQKLWTQVVKELLDNNTENVTKSELRELELQLQKKWKSLKDCFQKYYVNPKRTKRPYIYYKQLLFLLKDKSDSQIDPNASQDGGSSDSDNDPSYKTVKAWKCKRKWKIKKDEDQSSNDDDNETFDNQDESRFNNSNDEDYNVTANVPKRGKAGPEFTFANVDVPSRSESDSDPDKMFLLSLLPHLKTIPEEFRLNVKMELLQVLQNANYTTAREHKLI